MDINNNEVQFFEIEKVRFIMKDGCQLDISYAYEDLVFSEHSLFIIQFVKGSASDLNCWFNHECSEKYQTALFESLEITGKLNGMNLIRKGTFCLIDKPETEEIDIEFTAA
ncbi:MAG: hypothetical protein H6Q20_748 [Bacteroidetes bacterium]|jgi:hypothetical protein|nr:hypothetical protein [Bacteroidota bacterium]